MSNRLTKVVKQMIKLQVMYNLGKAVWTITTAQTSNFYGKYSKLCEKNMTRNVNNNTVGNTHQSAIEKLKVKVKKGDLSKEIFERSQ